MQSLHSLSPIHMPLTSTGEKVLQNIQPSLRKADPHSTIGPHSRLLCASLSQLALSCYEALGGQAQHEEVARCAALLSLLTKLDDQVIDHLDFHGKLTLERESNLQRVRAYLAPTLCSIHDAKPANQEPRCDFAAELGDALRTLSAHPQRLQRLLALITHGWEIQAQGVAWFASHPFPQQLEQIKEVTAEISGAWLLMITLVGSLPLDASRPLSLEEEKSFLQWGFWIQSADALADFEKDLGEGMGNAIAGHHLWLKQPTRFLQAYQTNDIPQLYEMLYETNTDLTLLPTKEPLQQLEGSLQKLPQVAQLLSWIQRFLIQRYLQHPLCKRKIDQTAFSRYQTTTNDPLLRFYQPQHKRTPRE